MTHEVPTTPEMPDTRPPEEREQEEQEGERYDGGDIPEADPDTDEAPDEE